jgi:secreted trypsin-like serine protease
MVFIFEASTAANSSTDTYCSSPAIPVAYTNTLACEALCASEYNYWISQKKPTMCCRKMAPQGPTAMSIGNHDDSSAAAHTPVNMLAAQQVPL